MVTAESKTEHPSGWAPLTHRLFRNCWTASLISNMGGWMQDTAGTWLMTSLTASPFLIALMQTAASMPVLMLGLPAGALADIVDRRRLLIVWQTWMLAAVMLLSVLTVAGIVSPATLLVLTFLLNIGVAMNSPGWQAIIPELVPRAELADAIALNSAGFNLARALGPALGGLAVAAFASAQTGSGTVFFFNSLSFVAVIAVLYTWKRTALFKSALPAERLFGSMRAGIRYVRHAPILRTVLLRTLLFTTFVSAMWALLAVVAQRDLHQGAMGYGILNGCIGLGAVAGATSLSWMRRRFSGDRIVVTASIVFACTLVALALVRSIPIIVIALIASGMCWTSTMSTFNVAVQLSVPSWVQARALGTYQMVFQGGMALGSAIWGFVAQHSSTPAALISAAAGLLIGLAAVKRFRLLRGAPPDVNPYGLDRRTLRITTDPQPTDGPVLVMIQFRIRPEDHKEFIHAMHAVRNVRMGDGAIRWGIYQDAAAPERFVETFVVESWLEYLRQRERMTTAGWGVRDRAWSFHQGDNPPIVSHMLYATEVEE
jgi:MFS family permease